MATDEHVLLASMPFAPLERPSLALGLLQAHANRLEIECETKYFTFLMADFIGVSNYQWLTDTVPYTTFAGDWLFSAALSGERPDMDALYKRLVLGQHGVAGDGELMRLTGLRDFVEPFLAACIESVAWADYTMVGFTSVFHQNIASLALAKRLKERHPHLTIAFGGANWEEEMGAAQLQQFHFVDLAFSGEADHSFPAVLDARREGRTVGGIAGVMLRGDEHSGAQAIENLDEVPVPDFDPYFAGKDQHESVRSLDSQLMMETARGCWWGERSHCTFCGLNGSTMAFRSKSPARVVDELRYLHERYPTTSASIVDDILDMRYFRSVLPEIAAADLDIDLFWEIKANLTHNQVRQLREARVMIVQPGIEALSDHVLDLMGKGTTALRNIQLLKWCKEYGVLPMWNLLYGFPDETDQDYEETIEFVNAIWHLDPPTGYGPIRLDRFSPYHNDPAAFGMTNVRPMHVFQLLYPFDTETLMRTAYYFEFDYGDGRTAAQFAATAIEYAADWKADTATGDLWVREIDGELEIDDTRRGVEGGQRLLRLDGWRAAAYTSMDRARTVGELMDMPEISSEAVAEDQLVEFLHECRDSQLAVTCAGQWLAVAVHDPPRPADAVTPRRLLHVRSA